MNRNFLSYKQQRQVEALLEKVLVLSTTLPDGKKIFRYTAPYTDQLVADHFDKGEGETKFPCSAGNVRGVRTEMFGSLVNSSQGNGGPRVSNASLLLRIESLEQRLTNLENHYFNKPNPPKIQP